MEDCNTIIKEPATVRSPSFPFQYGQWSTCRINITFPKGQYARVEILDMFLAVADTEADLISVSMLFLTYGAEFALFLAGMENSVLPMG